MRVIHGIIRCFKITEEEIMHKVAYVLVIFYEYFIILIFYKDQSGTTIKKIFNVFFTICTSDVDTDIKIKKSDTENWTVEVIEIGVPFQ